MNNDYYLNWRRVIGRLVSGRAKWRMSLCAGRICSERTAANWSTTASCTIWITTRCRTDPALSWTAIVLCSTTARKSVSSLRMSASVSFLIAIPLAADCRIYNISTKIDFSNNLALKNQTFSPKKPKLEQISTKNWLLQQFDLKKTNFFTLKTQNSAKFPPIKTKLEQISTKKWLFQNIDLKKPNFFTQKTKTLINFNKKMTFPTF